VFSAHIVYVIFIVILVLRIFFVPVEIWGDFGRLKISVKFIWLSAFL